MQPIPGYLVQVYINTYNIGIGHMYFYFFYLVQVNINTYNIGFIYVLFCQVFIKEQKV